MSLAKLQEKIDNMSNPTVVGLDPDLAHIPPEILERHIAEKGETLEAAAAAVVEFNTGLIDALYDIVPAVKPQSAYYEKLGPEGARALKTTCGYARSKGMYIIGDVKRNDIGTTAEAYSDAYIGTVAIGKMLLRPYDFDALTVNAYLGSDGVKPFVETALKYDKAVFVLVKTSNPSSGEFQDKMIGDKTLYSAVGDLIDELSRETEDMRGYSHIGAVVGATYPEEMSYLRSRFKRTFFLVPGYGAQGGSADTAALAFGKDGRGAIINSSRAIIAAWKKGGGDYREAARAEALRMRGDLRK